MVKIPDWNKKIPLEDNEYKNYPPADFTTLLHL